MARMNDIIRIFMERDELTEAEAHETYNEIAGEITEIIEEYEDDPYSAYEEVVDLLQSYELEPDYLDIFLF